MFGTPRSRNTVLMSATDPSSPTGLKCEPTSCQDSDWKHFRRLVSDRQTPGWMPKPRVQAFIHSVIQAEERSSRARWTEQDLRKWWAQLLKHCPGLDKTEARKFSWVKRICRGSWGPSVADDWPSFADAPVPRKKHRSPLRRLKDKDARLLQTAIQLEPEEERRHWILNDFSSWLDGVLEATGLQEGFTGQLEFALQVLDGSWGDQLTCDSTPR